MEGAQFHVYRGAEAPVDAGSLRERAGELTKRWLLVLLAERELERATGLLAGGIVEVGPQLCAALLAQVERGEDRASEPVLAGVDLAALVDARDRAEVSAALEALRRVVWQALREASGDRGAAAVWELADRLARVIERLRAGADGTRTSGTAGRTVREPEIVFGPPAVPAEPVDDPLGAAAPAAPEAPTAPASSEASGVPAAPAAPASIDAALDDAIVLARARGVPLSVLCVELESLERLPFPARPTRPAPPPPDAGIGDALQQALPHDHEILAESEHRAWVIATAWGHARSYDLALRIVDVAAGGPLGAVSVSVGVAVLGEDGDDAGALVAAAEEARFAAAASGISVLPPERHRRGSHLRGIDPQSP